MNCFTLEEWVDFSRRTMTPERIVEMQGHLDAGCVKCTQVAHIWRSLLDLATKQAAYEPPASAVRMAKASFARHLAPKAPTTIARAASLIFDSFRQPRLAGVRSTRQSVPQQLLYAAGEYLVDLRVEGGPKHLSMVGQILNSSNPSEAIKNVPVALLSRSEPIAKAVSTAFGEFHLEFDFEGGQDLQLAIGLHAGNSIAISLKDLKPPARRIGGAWQRSLRPYIFSGSDPFREQ